MQSNVGVYHYECIALREATVLSCTSCLVQPHAKKFRLLVIFMILFCSVPLSCYC